MDGVNRRECRRRGGLRDIGLGAYLRLSEAFHEIVEFGILASQRDPFDPMEKAFHDLGNARLAQTEHLHADWTLERGYSLSPDLLATSHVWKSPTGQDYVLATKGASEAIADLCHLNTERTKAIDEQVAAMAQDGLRVLGVAKGVFGQRQLPGEQHDFTFEFVGLVGLADPVAPGIEVHNYKFWFGEPTSQELIASNGIHAGLVIGDQRIRPANLDFNLEGVGLFRNGELAASGIGAEIMGGPLKSLRWLANHLLRHGEHLEAGQLVIPGSAVKLVSVEPDDRITASFTRTGSVSATFPE